MVYIFLNKTINGVYFFNSGLFNNVSIILFIKLAEGHCYNIVK